MKFKYRQFAHAGDLGLEIFAADMATLYENAALALYDMMTDLKQIKAVSSLDIQVTGANSAELLVAWLAELNFYTQSYFWLFCKFEIVELTDTQLFARVWGEKNAHMRHPIQLEIKAITFHQLHILQQPEGFQARLILDI